MTTKALKEIENNILRNEKTVNDFMVKHGIKKLRLYRTYYIDNGYQTIGYSLKNVNSNDIVQDYGGRKTKTFEL